MLRGSHLLYRDGVLCRRFPLRAAPEEDGDPSTGGDGVGQTDSHGHAVPSQQEDYPQRPQECKVSHKT